MNRQTWIRALWGNTSVEVAKSLLVFGLIAAVIVLAGFAQRGTRSPKPRAWNVYSQEANDHLYASRKGPLPHPAPLIAHAAGGLGDVLGSNSIEALDTNYAHGFRLFELDFCWTSDGQVVAAHDWKSFTGLQKLRGPTLSEFLARSSRKYSPTTLFMVYSWLERHSDAFIITDTKTRGMETLARVRMERPGLVPQFIPQIYLMEDYDRVRSQGFRHIILTLYRGLEKAPHEALLTFCKTRPLFAVTMPLATAQNSDMALKLREAGVATYAHTINDLALMGELRSRGVFGVYTDTLTPGALGLVSTP